MNINKDILRFSYLVLIIVSLFGSIYFIFGSAYARAYGGGEISWAKLFWEWKGLVITFIFSTIAFFGLKKPNKIGVLFSYSIPIGLGIYFVMSVINTTLNQFKGKYQLDFKNTLKLTTTIVLVIGICYVLILSTRKIEKINFKLRKYDYGIIFSLTLVLILAWYYMFKFYW